MEEQTPVQSIEDLQTKIEFGRAMKRLQDNPDFKLVFEKGFVENWALTQVYNVSTYAPTQRGAVMEQMLARSIFAVYCDDVVASGNIAVEELREQLEEEAIEAEVV